VLYKINRREILDMSATVTDGGGLVSSIFRLSFMDQGL